MNCKLVNLREDDGGWMVHICEVCHQEVKSHSPAFQTMRLCAKKGLGDYVADGLAFVGITKPAVAAVVGPCGCDERQEALNELGKKMGL